MPIMRSVRRSMALCLPPPPPPPSLLLKISISLSWLILLFPPIFVCLAERSSLPQQQAAPPISVAGPQLIEPANGSSTPLSHPHFMWTPPVECLLDAAIAGDSRECPSYTIQFSNTSSFAAELRGDATIDAVVSRFVPLQPFPPGPVWWRVRANKNMSLEAAGQTSSFHSLEGFSEPSLVNVVRISAPEKVFVVHRHNATFKSVRAVVAEAVTAAPNSKVLFEPGNYLLRPPPPLGGRYWPLLELTNVTDVVVDGQGANITFSGGFPTFVQILSCQRVLVENFTFDIVNPLPYTALSVTAVDFTGPTMHFIGELADGHPQLEDLASVLDGKASVMDPDSRTGPRTKRGATEVLYYGDFERVVSTRGRDRRDAGFSDDLGTAAHANWSTGVLSYRVNLTQPFPGLAVGDVVVMDPRITPGYVVDNSSEIVLSKLVAYACANECFTSEATDRLSILGCGLIRKPSRFLAANNGGHNHHSARVGQWIEGGTFENCGDDTMHVSGLVMSVANFACPQECAYGESTSILDLQPSSTMVFSQTYDRGRLILDVGDRLDFFDRSAGVLIATRFVHSVQPPSVLAGNSFPTTRVTLDAPISTNGIVPGPITAAFNESITQVFNFDAESTQLVVRDNIIRNGRRVGLLAKGHRALVQNNSFVGLGGGAVELWNAPYEGLCATSYVIQFNTMEDNNQLLRTAAPALWTEAFAPGGQRSCHGDVLFRNNTLAAGPGSMFLLGGISNVSIRGNNMTRCSTDSSPVVQVADSNVDNVVFDNSNQIHNQTWVWLCSK